MAPSIKFRSIPALCVYEGNDGKFSLTPQILHVGDLILAYFPFWDGNWVPAPQLGPWPGCCSGIVHQGHCKSKDSQHLGHWGLCQPWLYTLTCRKNICCQISCVRYGMSWKNGPHCVGQWACSFLSAKSSWKPDSGCGVKPESPDYLLRSATGKGTQVLSIPREPVYIAAHMTAGGRHPPPPGILRDSPESWVETVVVHLNNTLLPGPNKWLPLGRGTERIGASVGFSPPFKQYWASAMCL